MNAFATHFAYEFRTGIRNKQMLLLYYLFPLGFYLMMGFIMTAINPIFRDIIIPSMIAFAVLSASLLGIPEGLVNGRESGIFRSYKINGVPVESILSIPILTTILHLTILAAIITISAPLLFNAPLPTNWFIFAIIFLVFAFASTTLGALIGVIAPNSRMSVMLSQLIYVPSILLGGLMIPYSLLPEMAGKFAQLFPATHAMNAFNGLAMGGVADFSPWGSILVLLIGGVLAFGLAIYLFSWDSKNTARRGSPYLALLVLVPYVVGIFVLG